MKISWLTDIHLDLLNQGQRSAFYARILEHGSEAVLITGDIAEPPLLMAVLQELSVHIARPIYFVLGNHDYYHNNIAQTGEAVNKLCQQHTLLNWLTVAGMHRLTQKTVIVGVDGWADCRYGGFVQEVLSSLKTGITLAPQQMQDIADAMNIQIPPDGADDAGDAGMQMVKRLATVLAETIPDLQQEKDRSYEMLVHKRQHLADKDGQRLAVQLAAAAASKARKIIVLTHVPPFAQACWRHNAPCEVISLAYFTAKATGDVLEKFAREQPHINLLVLCGHTHCFYEGSLLPNLTVIVGAAKAGHPQIQTFNNID